MSNEEFYDVEIAPLLMELATKCEERGMSLVAAVEVEPGFLGHTRGIAANSSAAIRLIDVAVQANGNFDSLAIAVSRYAEKHGHSSVVLRMMGVES